MSDLNVSDVLAEANTLYNEVNETQQVDANIESALDTAEAVGASMDGIKTESISSVNLKLLKINMEHALGFDIITAINAGIKMEDGANRTQSSMVAESVKAVVRDFWNALKSSFNAIWARLKTWYITVTSASESLITKASKIKTEAEKLTTSPTERKFEFKNYKGIHIDGKIADMQLRSGLKDIKILLEQSLNVRTTSEVEKFIESAENALDDFVKSSNSSTPDSSWVNRFSDLYTPSVGVKTSALTDAFHKDQVIHDDANAEYKVTGILPGNRVVVFSEVKPSSTLPMHEKIALTFARIVNATKREATEQSIMVDTLHPAQILDICDTISDLNEQITFYEKAWHRRDKFMGTVIKKLDNSVEKINSEEVEDAQAKIYKMTTRGILSAIKRSNTYNASLLNMVLSVSAGSLAYCEASLGMYKAA